jgi:hypothetical protein
MGEHDQRLAGMRGESAPPERTTSTPSVSAPIPSATNGADVPEESPDVPSPQSRLDALRASGPVRGQ